MDVIFCNSDSNLMNYNAKIPLLHFNLLIMKKFIITLLCTLLSIPTAFAASIVSDYSSTIPQNYVETVAPVTITADDEGEIIAEHGINILIDFDRWILWNAVDSIVADYP